MPIAPATAPDTHGAPLFVVFNHRSGRGDAEAAIETIRSACERAGREVTIHRVEYDVWATARAYERTDLAPTDVARLVAILRSGGLEQP